MVPRMIARDPCGPASDSTGSMLFGRGALL